MAFRRACSYEATIHTPAAPETYTAILVTFKQGETVIQKDLNDLTLTASAVVVKLTQAETAMFEAKKQVHLQCRCYAATYDAPGSPIWSLRVEDALDDEVLPNE